MDKWQRLRELIAEFEERSRQKYAEHGIGGFAKIRYAPAFVNSNLRKATWETIYPEVLPAYWYIVYYKENGDYFHQGSKIGYSAEEVIEYILAQREAFP